VTLGAIYRMCTHTEYDIL